MKRKRKGMSRKYLHKFDYNSNFKRFQWIDSVECWVFCYFFRHSKKIWCCLSFGRGPPIQTLTSKLFHSSIFVSKKMKETNMKPRVDQCRHMINKWICNNKQYSQHSTHSFDMFDHYCVLFTVIRPSKRPEKWKIKVQHSIVHVKHVQTNDSIPF